MKKRNLLLALLVFALAFSACGTAGGTTGAAERPEDAGQTESVESAAPAERGADNEAVQNAGATETAGAYVLMNIPYAAFYAAEVTDGYVVDAVTSATMMKTRNGSLAGGSYHVDPAGSDITGVIYPVYTADAGALISLGGVEIKDDSKVEITLTNKGQDSTSVYEGADALFEAPSYSWYTLAEAPAQYKTLTVAGGVPAFSAVNTEPEQVSASAALLYDKHDDQVLGIAGMADVLGDQQISGVILTAGDGVRVGLQHVANIWRNTQLGFDFDSDIYAALAGKTITSIEYLTREGHYAFDTAVRIAEDQRLASLSDTYVELFPEFAKEEYKDYWLECIQAYPVDDAEVYYTMLTETYLGRLYGPEAMEAYEADPASLLFDCYFENGLAKLTVNGDEISGVDPEGNELFRHTYRPVADETVRYLGQELPAVLHIYQTEDPDAGLFTYFAFSDDTLAETQHIEFRYGETIEDLANYSEGAYAYWLASGIQDGYSDKLIKACIQLFVDENVGEQFQDADAIEIDSVEKLAAIHDNLSGHYVLTADLDLAGAEWTPLGAFVPAGESAEEQEVPAPDQAFTGSFDGQGHVIRNLVIDQPERWALGLFGCVANGEVGNFTLENATVDGGLMAGDVVGYAYRSTVSNVTLRNGKVTAHTTEMSAEGMYGGIVGAGMDSWIRGCSAQAEIVLPDNTANAGIVGGGLEATSVVDSSAAGTVTAGNNCYGIGGISGCGFGAEEFTNCVAENVQITVGDDCYWIGGITGYAGGFADAAFGVPVTVLTNCHAKDVTVTAGENAAGIGNIVGSGFYSEEVAVAMGAPFDQPTQYELVDCSAEPEIVPETGVFPAIAGTDGVTYESLFARIVNDTYRQFWIDYCAAVVGEAQAPAVVDGLQASVTSSLYGADAIAAFAEDGGMAFDCSYINGAERFTFQDDTVTILKADGSSETHTYLYVGQYQVGEGETMTYQGQEIPVAFPCDVYRSTDEAGEFNYFFLRDDTMETTYHIEFRYGKSLDDLKGYFVGPYAYWLAAGIDTAADEQTIENVIALFCLENMDYAAHAEEAIAQLEALDFIGEWVADLSAFGEAYADVSLSFTIDENGHGVTVMNGQQTRDFEAYAVDNGETGDGKGLYVAYDNLEFAPEAAVYTMETDETGSTVLTFYAADGIISYTKAK